MEGSSRERRGGSEVRRVEIALLHLLGDFTYLNRLAFWLPCIQAVSFCVFSEKSPGPGNVE